MFVLGLVGRMLLGWALTSVPGEARADFLPTVRFAFPQNQAVEIAGNVPVALVINQPPTVQTSVYVDLTAVTATDGVDFVGGSTFAVFEPTGPDTVYAYVELKSDGIPEDPETIQMDITPSPGWFDIGQPGTATLTIIDDDSGTPTAHFEYPDTFPYDFLGRIVLAGWAGTAAAVDVVVDNLPPGGATIHYTDSGDNQIHDLVVDGSARQTIEVTPPAAGPGADFSETDLRILNPPAKVVADDWFFYVTFIGSEFPNVEDGSCIACAFIYAYLIAYHLDCDIFVNSICSFTCPTKKSNVGVPAPGALARAMAMVGDLETLRRYRDEVLAGTTSGDIYIQLYHDVSPGLINAFLQRPSLIHHVADVWDRWLPAVAALVDGNGASFMINSDMQTALLQLIADLSDAGSPQLAASLAEFSTATDLAHVAGLSASALQTRLDNSSLGAETTSWGAVKSMFR